MHLIDPNTAADTGHRSDCALESWSGYNDENHTIVASVAGYRRTGRR